MPNFSFFEDYDQITSPDRILYHGSRGGIIGPIAPRSRPGTDFGEGFYMGTDPMQTKGLVAAEAQPVSYALSVDFSDVSHGQVLVLDRYEWIYTILHFRRTCRPFNGSAIDESMAELTRGFDFIMGPIADDRTNEAVRRFAANELTDEGLFACLSRMRYGTQIVAKTEDACRRIEVVAEQIVYELIGALTLGETIARHPEHADRAAPQVPCGHTLHGGHHVLVGSLVASRGIAA